MDESRFNTLKNEYHPLDDTGGTVEPYLKRKKVVKMYKQYLLDEGVSGWEVRARMLTLEPIIMSEKTDREIDELLTALS